MLNNFQHKIESEIITTTNGEEYLVNIGFDIGEGYEDCFEPVRGHYTKPNGWTLECYNFCLVIDGKIEIEIPEELFHMVSDQVETIIEEHVEDMRR